MAGGGHGIALETVSFRTAIVESDEVRGDARWQLVRRSKDPALPVVLLEDLGAEVGLFIALAAIVVGTLLPADPLAPSLARGHEDTP